MCYGLSRLTRNEMSCDGHCDPRDVFWGKAVSKTALADKPTMVISGIFSRSHYIDEPNQTDCDVVRSSEHLHRDDACVGKST